MLSKTILYYHNKLHIVYEWGSSLDMFNGCNLCFPFKVVRYELEEGGCNHLMSVQGLINSPLNWKGEPCNVAIKM